MIDLTRRNFIKNVGFVGVTTIFCSSLVAQNTFNFSDLDKEEENVLSRFSKLNSSNTFLLDQSLLDCYNSAASNWEKTGYKPSGDFCYSSKDGHLKMFPMHLDIDGAGKLDDVLLCFGKNTNGEWKTLKSLSGFDLEAISVAMKELKLNNSHVDLSHYLFPAPAQQLTPYGFITKKGSVFLKTTLSHKSTSTEILIKEGHNIVYQAEVISKHSLTVNSILV
ncbi:hypothetical protein [Flavobacterium sp.]|uniref:hypothetical protein n=1 Tax=Flavobacterium sp. TaxID=239 RepID=UPI00374DF010